MIIIIIILLKSETTSDMSLWNILSVIEIEKFVVAQC